VFEGPVPGLEKDRDRTGPRPIRTGKLRRPVVTATATAVQSTVHRNFKNTRTVQRPGSEPVFHVLFSFKYYELFIYLFSTVLLVVVLRLLNLKSLQIMCCLFISNHQND
jgi:hypothetical protein